MLYMIVETFRNKDPRPIYARFAEKGRMAPDGLTYISSWIDDKMETCFQVMETDDRALIDEWIAKWDDIVSFEVLPVFTSAETVQRVADLPPLRED